MANFCMLGRAGSGKSKQGELIGNNYGYAIFNTGEFLRHTMAKKIVMEEIIISMERGVLVDDSIVLDIIPIKLSNRYVQEDNKIYELFHPQSELPIETTCSKKRQINGIVFDGFPRTVIQFESYKDMINDKQIPQHLQIDAFLYLDVTQEEALRRITEGGGGTRNRTDDLDMDVLKRRHKCFDHYTGYLIKHIHENYPTIIHTIDGMGSKQETADKISEIVKMYS